MLDTNEVLRLRPLPDLIRVGRPLSPPPTQPFHGIIIAAAGGMAGWVLIAVIVWLLL